MLNPTATQPVLVCSSSGLSSHSLCSAHLAQRLRNPELKPTPDALRGSGELPQLQRLRAYRRTAERSGVGVRSRVESLVPVRSKADGVAKSTSHSSTHLLNCWLTEHTTFQYQIRIKMNHDESNKDMMDGQQMGVYRKNVDGEVHQRPPSSYLVLHISRPGIRHHGRILVAV